MIPPGGRIPRKPEGRLTHWRMAIEVLVREAGFGVLLWSGATGVAGTRVVTSVLGLCAIIAATRRFPLLRPQTWKMAVWEGALLFFGAVCVSNLLTMAFGVAPWWRN